MVTTSNLERGLRRISLAVLRLVVDCRSRSCSYSIPCLKLKQKKYDELQAERKRHTACIPRKTQAIPPQ